MIETVIRKSSELRRNDVVLTHGMRVLLVSEPHSFRSNGPIDQLAYSFTGTILNMDDVLKEGHVPASFIRDGSWTVQGNDFVSWSVEIR